MLHVLSGTKYRAHGVLIAARRFNVEEMGPSQEEKAEGEIDVYEVEKHDQVMEDVDAARIKEDGHIHARVSMHLRPPDQESIPFAIEQSNRGSMSVESNAASHAHLRGPEVWGFRPRRWGTQEDLDIAGIWLWGKPAGDEQRAVGRKQLEALMDEELKVIRETKSISLDLVRAR
ncbi:hypothetical protein ONZ45_g2000 [Pleurotus djamor]|nr:hypothetical protein ONZ45_g2000 [Pleurotus djamor]